ncbi:MAG: hypothetical protein AVDCRST_MAG11-4043, partial [uncultured Gemmatimonadaceae bacterium]
RLAAAAASGAVGARALPDRVPRSHPRDVRTAFVSE